MRHFFSECPRACSLSSRQSRLPQSRWPRASGCPRECGGRRTFASTAGLRNWLVTSASRTHRFTTAARRPGRACRTPRSRGDGETPRAGARRRCARRYLPEATTAAWLVLELAAARAFLRTRCGFAATGGRAPGGRADLALQVSQACSRTCKVRASSAEAVCALMKCG